MQNHFFKFFGGETFVGKIMHIDLNILQERKNADAGQCGYSLPWQADGLQLVQTVPWLVMFQMEKERKGSLV